MRTLTRTAAILLALAALQDTPQCQIVVHVETLSTGSHTLFVDPATGGLEVPYGHLHIQAYPYRPGAWRVILINQGPPEAPAHMGWTPHREVITNLTFVLPPSWLPRWASQTGLNRVTTLPDGRSVWHLANPNEHPGIPAPQGAQLLTGGTSIYWEFVAPGVDPRTPLPTQTAREVARAWLLMQNGADSAWGSLHHLRGLYTWDAQSLGGTAPVEILGDYCNGGWSQMYPGAAAQEFGPVFWLLPRWSSGEHNSWHYALPTACFENYLRTGNTNAYRLGMEMVRRQVTVGMCRNESTFYRWGFWYEKGYWPGSFDRPKVEKAWDRSWVLAMLFTPWDPMWYEVYEGRRDRLLAYIPYDVWPEQYGARRPARLLQNLADLMIVAPPADRSLIRQQARDMLAHVWNTVPVSQHYLHGDAPQGLGSSSPLAGVPSVKIFMQMQWPVACARWMLLGEGLQYFDRLRDMVQWQVDNWAVETPTNVYWPYAVAENDPTQKYWQYTVSSGTWAQGTMAIAALTLGGHYVTLWQKNALTVLPLIGPGPSGLGDASGGPGRLKTYTARLLATRDLFIP